SRHVTYVNVSPTCASWPNLQMLSCRGSQRDGRPSPPTRTLTGPALRWSLEVLRNCWNKLGSQYHILRSARNNLFPLRARQVWTRRYTIVCFIPPNRWHGAVNWRLCFPARATISQAWAENSRSAGQPQCGDSNPKVSYFGTKLPLTYFGTTSAM